VAVASKVGAMRTAAAWARTNGHRNLSAAICDGRRPRRHMRRRVAAGTSRARGRGPRYRPVANPKLPLAALALERPGEVEPQAAGAPS